MRNSFRYSLEALLKKRSWDLESVRLEEVEAREAREKQQARYDTQAARVMATEEELRGRNAPDSAIDAERYQALMVFLGDARRVLSEEQTLVDAAEAQHAEVLERLHFAKRSLRALERHRDRKEEEFRLEEDRKGIRESDELWLLRLGAKNA